MRRDFLLITLLILLGLPLTLFAATPTFEGQIVTLPSIGNVGPPNTLLGYINYFFVAAIGLAGISALLMITIAGIQYSVSGAVDTKARAKGQIFNALLGLALILFSYIILRTINPDLVNLRAPSLTSFTVSTIENRFLPRLAPKGVRPSLSQEKKCEPGLTPIPPLPDPKAICLDAKELAQRCEARGGTLNFDTGECLGKEGVGEGKEEDPFSLEGDPVEKIQGGGFIEGLPRARGIAEAGSENRSLKMMSRDAWASFDVFQKEFADDCLERLGVRCWLLVTSTLTGEHKSSCHVFGNTKSGTCADMVIFTESCRIPPNGANPNWNCNHRQEALDIFIATANSSKAILSCADEYNGKTALSTADHFHCSFARIK